jgi:ubiquinone biosynthesis protein COQ4
MTAMNGMTQAKSGAVSQPFWGLMYRLKLLFPMLKVQTSPAYPPFLAMLAGGASLDVVGEMSLALLGTPSFELAVRHLQQDPACAALIADRYLPPPHDLDALLRYPSDSLGYIYATQMQAQGFRSEELYAGLPVDSDMSYVEVRLGQTHDIWHIITGFGTTIADEMGLQAFHLPQFPYPLAVTLLSSSIMSTLLFSPEELPPLLTTIQRGWEMGKQAKPLFAQKWEEGWDKPLTEWQRELGIQPIPSV